jgi:hypothetical protein
MTANRDEKIKRAATRMVGLRVIGEAEGREYTPQDPEAGKP